MKERSPENRGHDACCEVSRVCHEWFTMTDLPTAVEALGVAPARQRADAYARASFARTGRAPNPSACSRPAACAGAFLARRALAKRRWSTPAAASRAATPIA